MARKGSAPPPEPHIVQTCYDDGGRIIGYIADNNVERDPAKVREMLDNIARIWAREKAKSMNDSRKEEANL